MGELDLAEHKRRQKEFHEAWRAGTGLLPAVTVESVDRDWFQPCYAGGSDKYSDNKEAFYRFVQSRGGWEGLDCLDYACGTGPWSVFMALTGARSVVGFDLAETGIRRGRERVEAQGLSDRVDLRVMDACDLSAFPDGHFDFVLGAAVLHHVFPYPNIFEELHRVMKPGARAYFLENLADFPPFHLYWKLKGDIDAGDVPIYSRDLRQRTRMFSRVTIHGDTLFYSIKTFIWKPEMGRLRRGVLRAAKALDAAVFRVVPPLRRWGCFSYIELVK